MILSISGKDFSSVYGTIARISSTACSDSKWRSTSSMACRVPLGVGHQLPFAVSSLKKISKSKFDSVNHNFQYLSTTLSTKAPSSGSLEVLPVSSALGHADYSSRTRLMFSSYSSHRWSSDTSVSLKMTSFMMSSLTNVVMSLAMNLAEFRNSQSFDAPLLWFILMAGNASASSGSIFSIISGERFGVFGVSSAVRIAATSCLVSSWISDSVMKCKIPTGVGIVNSMMLSGSAYESVFSQKLPVKQSLYKESVLTSFLVSRTSIRFQGINFGSVSPNDASIVQQFNTQIPPNAERILVSSSALTEQRAIFSISVSVTISAIPRFDDMVLLLEVFQSKNLDTSTQLVLFQSQCFGCLIDSGSTLRFDFTDNAAAPVPLSRCGTYGSYRPKNSNFASIYGFSGIMNLKVVSGSNAITFQSVSIVVQRSNINVGFFQILGNGDIERTASKSISWISDSTFSTTIPAIVGRNVSTQGVIHQQYSNFLHGVDYPAAEFANVTETFPCSGSRSVSLMGSFFGQFDSTIRLRVGSSSCAATSWISDVAVVCRRLAAGQANERLSLQASVGKIVGGTPTRAQYVVSSTTSSPAMLPSTESAALSMVIFWSRSCRP